MTKSQQLSSDDMVFKIKADFLKALSHPLRLKVIEHLRHGESNAGKLAKTLGIHQSTLSKHLTALREIGILQARQEGTAVFYTITDQDLFLVLRPISELLRKKFKRSNNLLSRLANG